MSPGFKTVTPFLICLNQGAPGAQRDDKVSVKENFTLTKSCSAVVESELLGCHICVGAVRFHGWTFIFKNRLSTQIKNGKIWLL